MSTARKRGDAELPDGWRVVRLGDVATLQRGIDLPEADRLAGQVPVYGSNGLLGYHDSSPIGGPGVITGRSGSIGFVYYCETVFWPLNTTLYVKDFHGNNKRYVYHLLSNLHLERFSASTGVPSLNRNFVHPYLVTVPPLSEQRDIADVLDSIDEVIERTEAVITATETLSDSLLHELLTRGVPGWHTEWKDVPGIGTIPADWEVVRGDAIFKLGGGCAPSDFEFVDNGAALFIKVNDLNIKGQSRYVRTSQLRWNQDGSKFKPIPPPVIVFPKRGAAIFINRVAIVQQLSVVDPNLMTVTALNGLNIEFLRYLLLQIGLHRLCDNSGIPQINNKHLYPKLFALPGFKERDTIAAALERVNGTLDRARKHRDGLKSLKESTAAELLTGKVRMHG